MLYKYPPPRLRAKKNRQGGGYLNQIERTVKISPLNKFICQKLSLQRYLPGDLNSPLLSFFIVIFYFNILVFRPRELFVIIVKTTPLEFLYVKQCPCRYIYQVNVKKRKLVIVKKFDITHISIPRDRCEKLTKIVTFSKPS